jgi:hypothetical protein
MLTGGGVAGSFTFTADFRSGAFTRRILLFQRSSAFIARATTTFLATFLGGAGVGIIFGFSGAFFANAWRLELSSIIAFSGVAGMGAVWGFAVGSLIRNHLVSLFAVPLSLVLPDILASSPSEAQIYLFPIQAAEWANQTAAHIPALGALLGAVTWLLFVAGVAFLVLSQRDLA